MKSFREASASASHFSPLVTIPSQTKESLNLYQSSLLSSLLPTNQKKKSQLSCNILTLPPPPPLNDEPLISSRINQVVNLHDLDHKFPSKSHLAEPRTFRHCFIILFFLHALTYARIPCPCICLDPKSQPITIDTSLDQPRRHRDMRMSCMRTRHLFMPLCAA